MYAGYYLNTQATYVPKTMTKDFRLILTLAKGEQKILDISNNFQRLVHVDISVKLKSVRFEPLSTWGNTEAHIFSFEIE